MIPFLWIVGIADWLGLGPKRGWLSTYRTVENLISEMQSLYGGVLRE